eukprot:10169735-Karenia_brevis.AAC.1
MEKDVAGVQSQLTIMGSNQKSGFDKLERLIIASRSSGATHVDAGAPGVGAAPAVAPTVTKPDATD